MSCQCTMCSKYVTAHNMFGIIFVRIFDRARAEIQPCAISRVTRLDKFSPLCPSAYFKFVKNRITKLFSMFGLRFSQNTL
jgi:hypothetical protein